MHNITQIDGGVCASDGFFADGVSAGLKPDGAKDLAFIYSDVLCEIASVFTTNKMSAAPIKHFKNKGEFKTNFVLINSKNANAMTGEQGIKDIDDIFDNINIDFKNPIMSSTGVIGVSLPKDKIIESANKFDLTAKNGENLSRAIMTTDSYPKSCLYEVKLEDGSSFKLGAIAKGAGMINPSLATMLCFICTDAIIPTSDIKELLREYSTTTFNAISVDGDTSTNDTVMLLSNGKSNSYDKEAFAQALKLVMEDMAQLIVSDGEGAKKSVAFEVSGAKTYEDAQIAAKALSNSLLVKTALFGEDPNWGRIASTIGASGVEAYEDKLTIKFGDILVYDRGEILFSKETEQEAANILKVDRFTISCDLGVGEESFTAYGCDLGYDYVKINADYRT